MRYFLLSIAVTSILIIISCTNHNKLNYKRIDIDVLTMQVPSSYQFKPQMGVDTYVGYLYDDKYDTFFIEFGNQHFVDHLFVDGPTIFSEGAKGRFTKNLGKVPGPDEALFSKFPEEDTKEAIFQKNYYLYDTINRIVVKIVQPKKIGEGITGIYIPQLRDSNSVNVYANNLDSAHHVEALKMFRTIQYR